MRAYRTAVVAMLFAATPLLAADVKSGIPVGGRIGTYSTTKCAGAKDGVKEGKSLCYT